MALKRMNINLSDELTQRLDAYAESIGVTRTAAISFFLDLGIKVYGDLDKTNTPDDQLCERGTGCRRSPS